MKHIIGINDEDLQPFYMDWENKASHLLVGGTYQSGRTSLLRTIVLGLSHKYSPDELHIVLFDASGRSLTDLEDLPHVIARVDGEDAFAENIAHLQHELELRRKGKKKNNPEILFVFDDYDLATDAMGLNERILLELGKNIRQDSNLGFHFLISLLASHRLHVDSLINQLKLLRVGVSLGNTETLEALGAHITASMRKEQLPRGRGYFFARSGMTLVQFANPDKSFKSKKAKDTVISKWNKYKKAEWINPANEDRIQQVKSDSAPDIRAIQQRNISTPKDPSSKTFIDMEESVRRYVEQQQKIKNGEA